MPLHICPSNFALQLVTVGHAKPSFVFGSSMQTDAEVTRAGTKWRDKQGRRAQLHWAVLKDAVVSGHPRAPRDMEKYQRHCGHGLRPLLGRTFPVAARNPGIALGRIVTCTASGLLIGLLYQGGQALQSRGGQLVFFYSALFVLPFTDISLYRDDRHHFQGTGFFIVLGRGTLHCTHEPDFGPGPRLCGIRSISCVAWKDL